MSTLENVAEFHHAFGHPVEPAPTASTPELRELRVRLIAEELMELATALGVSIHVDAVDGLSSALTVTATPSGHVDLVAAADALGDLDYVVQGGNLVLGLPGDAIANEIHRSNMSKLGADGKPVVREDGKILKGPNYSPPDIARVLWGSDPTPVGYFAVTFVTVRALIGYYSSGLWDVFTEFGQHWPSMAEALSERENHAVRVEVDRRLGAAQ